MNPKQRTFESIFRSTYREILAYSMRRTSQPADAADVVGETFAVAWRRLDDIPAGQERAWLFGVARKVMANQRRGDVRRAALGDRLTRAIEVEVEGVSGAWPEPVDETGPATRAFAGLPERDREVLALLAWEGLDIGEVAIALGVRKVTARSRIHRARGRLRRALAEAADPAEVLPKSAVALVSAPGAASGKGVK